MSSFPDDSYYTRFEKLQAILEDAPDPEEELIEYQLRRIGALLPTPIQYQYDAGQAVNQRWHRFRAETVAIPANNHIPAFYPWIFKVDTPAELSKTTHLLGTPEEQSPDYWKYQAVIRWRVWKQSQANIEGFLEIALVPNPTKESRWKDRFSFHTFGPRLSTKPLEEFFKATREKGLPGRRPIYESEEILLYNLEAAYKAC